MTYGSKTSIINDDNWVDSVSLYQDVQMVFLRVRVYPLDEEVMQPT